MVKKFTQLILMKITTGTVQTPTSSPKKGKFKHFTETKDTFCNVRFYSNFLNKYKANVFFKTYTKKCAITNSKTSYWAFFQNAARDIFSFLIIYIFLIIKKKSCVSQKNHKNWSWTNLRHTFWRKSPHGQYKCLGLFQN